jgi:hypothetical protein
MQTNHGQGIHPGKPGTVPCSHRTQISLISAPSKSAREVASRSERGYLRCNRLVHPRCVISF